MSVSLLDMEHRAAHTIVDSASPIAWAAKNGRITNLAEPFGCAFMNDKRGYGPYEQAREGQGDRRQEEAIGKLGSYMVVSGELGPHPVAQGDQGAPWCILQSSQKRANQSRPGIAVKIDETLIGTLLKTYHNIDMF